MIIYNISTPLLRAELTITRPNHFQQQLDMFSGVCSDVSLPIKLNQVPKCSLKKLTNEHEICLVELLVLFDLLMKLIFIITKKCKNNNG